MSNTFAITTATNSVILNDQRQGEVSFTVTNASGRQLPGRAHIVPRGEAQADWFSLAGESEREFAIAGVQQYTVRINVPPEAAAGSYLFRLDAVGIRVPDEEFAEGPSVTFVVPEQVEETKPFPWWIIVVIAAVLLLGGIGTAVYLLTRPPELALAVTPSSDPAVAGEALTYNISVTNNGRRAANQVVVESALPEGVSFLAAEQCDYFESLQAIRCLLPEPLQRNDERSVSVSVQVGGTTRGVISYTVGLTSSDIEPTDAPLVTVGTAVTAEVDLEAEVSGPAAPVVVGNDFDYTITIHNRGPSDATNLTMTYDQPTGIESASLPDNCQSDSDTIRCILTTLRAGESVVVTISLIPGPVAAGTRQDSFRIVSNETELSAGPVTVELVDLSADFVTYEDARLPYQIGHPADWLILESEFEIIISNKEDQELRQLLDEGRLDDVVFVILSGGDQAGVQDSSPTAVIDGLLGFVKGGFGENVNIIEGPTQFMVSEHEAVLLIVTLTDEDIDLTLLAAAVINAEQERVAVFLGGTSPVGTETFMPTLRAMVDTIEFTRASSQ